MEFRAGARARLDKARLRSRPRTDRELQPLVLPPILGGVEAARAAATADPQHPGWIKAMDDADSCLPSARTLFERLRTAGLRPTRQRLALAQLLFRGYDRHFTAEMLHAEAVEAGERVSLATVYNTLHQFRRAGLLRELAIGGAKTYFDTNTSNHNHFFVEDESRLIDIPGTAIEIGGLPAAPEGTRVSHIDVVVRLVRERELPEG